MKIRQITKSAKQTKEIKPYFEMTKKELLAEKAKIEMHLERFSESTQDTLPTVELFHSVLVSAFIRHLGLEIVPLFVLKQRSNVATYRLVKKTAEWLDSWGRNCMSNRLTRQERTKLYTLFADLTISFMKEANMIVTLKTLLNSHEIFPSVFERSFPGYATSGLLQTVLRTREQTPPNGDE